MAKKKKKKVAVEKEGEKDIREKKMMMKMMMVVVPAGEGTPTRRVPPLADGGTPGTSPVLGLLLIVQ